MNIFVLDKNLDAISVMDTYGSLIWTERFNQYGDFEIYTLMSDGILDVVKRDYYLQRGDSDRLMIIETIKINSDVEEGNTLTVTGRSLESILDRRIVWGQKSISGNLQNGIQTLLNENIISPSDPNRKISNFIFEVSDDPEITKLEIEAQYTGDNLYDVISNICSERGIGFKVYYNGDTKQFIFKLYAGQDRSYDQIENPYVIFSPYFENILNSNYVESSASLKNVTLIGGEGEGTERKYTSVGTVTGLDRRELFTDARDISSDTEDKILTDAEYTAQLQQRGNEKLAENSITTSFEGEIDTTTMFRYGEDFFNGDIVQIENEYGHRSKVRILEIVTSDNDDGFYVYPTFSTIDEQKGEEVTA